MKYVRVRDILALPFFAQAKLLAGKKGLDKEVRAVTVAEIPDIALWLGGKDFVHSVCRFMLSEDEAFLLQWVQGLYQAGASCLAVKTKRFLAAVPPSVLAFGDEYAFPIIELPLGLSQSAITGNVLNLIIKNNEQQAADNKDYQENLLASGKYKLLSFMLKDRSLAWDYCQSILGPLVTDTRKQNQELLKTLALYLASKRSYALTAKKSGLHVNTVKYRMARIKERIPVDLSSFNDLCLVWFALQIYQRISEVPWQS